MRVVWFDLRVVFCLFGVGVAGLCVVCCFRLRYGCFW